jgi:hypothetical protein
MKRRFYGYEERTIKVDVRNEACFNGVKSVKREYLFRLHSLNKYSYATSFGNEWELFEIYPIDNSGNRIKLRIKGYYHLISFIHGDAINAYDDYSHVLIEYGRTGKKFILPSFINLENVGGMETFELSRLNAKSIEKFVRGNRMKLNEQIPEKLANIFRFFNLNLNPKKLLEQKKSELVIGLLEMQKSGNVFQISTDGKKCIVLRTN